MYQWLTDHKLPLGSWVKTFVDMLNENAQSVFDIIALVIGTGIDTARHRGRS
jgi:glycine betaine/proline transport system permease protein